MLVHLRAQCDLLVLVEHVPHLVVFIASDDDETGGLAVACRGETASDVAESLDDAVHGVLRIRADLIN